MKKEELLDMYKCVIRPVLDFACVVYHSLLNKAQTEELEKMQRVVMKIIDFENYKVIEIEPLRTRRISLLDKFALKAEQNQNFKRWFPRKDQPKYGLRVFKPFEEYKPKTERMSKKTLYHMRKRLSYLSKKVN